MEPEADSVRAQNVIFLVHRVSDAGEVTSKTGRVDHSHLPKGDACE